VELLKTMTDTNKPIPEHLAPQQGELIMFENNRFLERMSRMRPTTVLIVYLPVIAVSIYLSIAGGTGVLPTLGLVLAGAVFWTFFEYFFHRFVFHFNATTPFQHKILFTIHGVHHQYPNDKDRLVMPITVSIPLAVLFSLLFVSTMGDAGWGFFAGFGAGYVAYDMMHYAVHHVQNSKFALFRKIRRHHMAHHFRDTRLGFGVSSYFWDRVFRT
jgi:sterol desaturase/sphingolipid hydroxylase (fatty acid hydroxylase superfamily)